MAYLRYPIRYITVVNSGFSMEHTVEKQRSAPNCKFSPELLHYLHLSRGRDVVGALRESAKKSFLMDVPVRPYLPPSPFPRT